MNEESFEDGRLDYPKIDQNGDGEVDPADHESFADAPDETEAPPEVRPLWIPPGVKFETLSKTLQLALRELITPAYRELVLEVAGALEKSTGLTYVHLMWLELLQQIGLGEDVCPRLARGVTAAALQDGIGGHLHLVSAKERVGRFLLQLRNFTRKTQHEHEFKGFDRMAKNADPLRDPL
jgi:hypothetical protein